MATIAVPPRAGPGVAVAATVPAAVGAGDAPVGVDGAQEVAAIESPAATTTAPRNVFQLISDLPLFALVEKRRSYAHVAVIVDLDPGKARAGQWGPLAALAVAVIALGFGALLVRPPDPDSAAKARARVLAVLAAPTATAIPAPVAGAPLGPSVLARRTPRPSLPPPLTLPQDVASFVPVGTADATREVLFNVSETSRPTVYRLADGRMLVIQQMPPGRGRPLVPTAAFEEGIVRGQPAGALVSSVGRIRALVWWTEGPATYYLYSSTLTIRELVILAEQLR